jgi:DNA transformation protein
MAADRELVEHCRELLAPLGTVRARRMFGGHGFYIDELFVALIAFGRLYLKADATTRPRFEAAGCEPFVYDGQSKPVTMGYFTAPDDAMESPALMQPWARLALEAALRARAAKKAPAKPARPGR